MMVAAGDSSVTPPVQSGQEYGGASCGKLGAGVQHDVFAVTDGGDTQSTFTWYFQYRDAARHVHTDATGRVVELPQRRLLGTLTASGGTGALKGLTGTGTMRCTSADGIHTSCTTKLTLKKRA